MSGAFGRRFRFCGLANFTVNQLLTLFGNFREQATFRTQRLPIAARMPAEVAPNTNQGDIRD